MDEFLKKLLAKTRYMPVMPDRHPSPSAQGCTPLSTSALLHVISSCLPGRLEKMISRIYGDSEYGDVLVDVDLLIRELEGEQIEIDGSDEELEAVKREKSDG